MSILVGDSKQLIELPPGRKWFIAVKDGPARDLIRTGSRTSALHQEVRCLVDGEVVDAGSHIGSFAMDMAAVATKVHAFEPQPAVFIQLCANLALNGITNVIPYCLGLGNAQQNGQSVGMLEPPADTSEVTRLEGSAMPKGWFGSSDRIVAQVPLRSLDSYEFKEVGFIKIDVEGYELNVLEGAKRLLAEQKPCLLLECFGAVDERARPLAESKDNATEQHRSKCFALLQAGGYQIIPAAGAYADYICIHRDSPKLSVYVEQQLGAAKRASLRNEWLEARRLLSLIPPQACTYAQQFRRIDELMLAAWFAGDMDGYNAGGHLMLRGLAAGHFETEWKEHASRLARNIGCMRPIKYREVLRVHVAKFADATPAEDAGVLVEVVSGDYDASSYWALPGMNPRMTK